MKVIAAAQRLLREWKIKALAELDATGRLELLDALNGAVQAMHAVGPSKNEITQGSLSLDAPTSATLTLTNGSTTFTGYTATSGDLYCTVRIEGDDIDNQISGSGELLHPYGGTTGSHTATIYHDAITIPEPYSELVGNPYVLELRRTLLPYPGNTPFIWWRDRCVAGPQFYLLEANSRNQNPPAPAVFRTNTLPDTSYRMRVGVKLAPVRVTMADLMGSDTEIPVSTHHIELYFMPMARRLMAQSALWENPSTAGQAMESGDLAERNYQNRASFTMGTPANCIGTPYGY